MRLLRLVWTESQKHKGFSWECLNHSMRDALALVIGAGMELKAKDFDAIWGELSGGRWVGADDSWMYSMAVCVGNTSVIKSIEDRGKFRPWIANNVLTNRSESGAYMHGGGGTRRRERLSVGFGVEMDGRMWFVTQIKDESIRFCSYRGRWPEGNPERRCIIQREAFARLFPSPKKMKKDDQQ